MAGRAKDVYKFGPIGRSLLAICCGVVLQSAIGYWVKPLEANHRQVILQ
jgi:hypothetical protein